MFRPTQDTQISFDDRMLTANKQTKKAIDASRAKLVGDVIYPNVDEEKFSRLFSEKGSRPNIPIRKYVSALVLKRMYGLSDEVMIEFLRCGALNFQYAIHSTQDDSQPISESSLRRFRRALEKHNADNKCDLVKEECIRISKLMAVDMGLLGADPDSSRSEADHITVRMDSMEIECRAKHMTRLEIIYMTTVVVIRYLLRKDFAEVIPEELSHYLREGDRNNVLYYRASGDQKAGVQDDRVSGAVREMLSLQKAMTDNFTPRFLDGVPEYQVLQRVIEEQTTLLDGGARVPKDKSEIPASSVQNPFDTTATYRFKHGHHRGFAMNVAEVIDGNGNGIVIHADLRPNNASDQEMARGYVNDQPDDGPEQVVTVDGGYNDDELEKTAKGKNITIKTSALTGRIQSVIFADFVLNDDETEVLTCPGGFHPIGCSYNEKTGAISATFSNSACSSCPYRSRCGSKCGKDGQNSKLRITAKQVRRAMHAKGLSTEEARDLANARNGVEGIMSVMRRKYHIDNIPVFGIDRSKTWVWSTLLAYNLVKYKKYMDSTKQSQAA